MLQALPIKRVFSRSRTAGILGGMGGLKNFYLVLLGSMIIFEFLWVLKQWVWGSGLRGVKLV